MPAEEPPAAPPFPEPPRRARYPSLEAKRVLISGGASGIGAVLVESFHAQGARVAFFDVDEAAAAALLARLTPPAPLFARVDVRDIPALQAAIAEAAGALGGGLDVLVNNAANDQRHAFDDLTPDYWDENQAVNLRHHVFASQAAARLMPAGGSIVMLGSVSWRRRRKGFVSYATAKAAIHGLTRVLAQELGGRGVRVNSVSPGAIKTAKQMAAWVDPALEQHFLEEQALKFRLEAEDVAALVLFLASEDARACSGQDFLVDGGIV